MSKSPEPLPLQSKMSILLLLASALFIGLAYAILKMLISPAFEDLELRSARADLIRAEQAIKTDIRNLANVTTDWAYWDDLHDYSHGNNPRFVASNLVQESLENLGLDFLVVHAVDTEQDWAYVLYDGERRPSSELGILNPADTRSTRLLSHANEDDKTVGVILTDLGPALVASLPILRSDELGPIAGSLIMGQFLNAARMQRMQERTEVDMSWALASGFDDDSPVTHDEGLRSFAVERAVVSGHTTITDIYAAPLLVLHTETPRDISYLGEQSVRVTLLSLGVAGILLTLLIGYLLRQVILEPVEALDQHISALRKSGDLSRNLGLNRNDEIGRLANQFDELTTEVHEARQALLDQSFKAGKADTAAEVLHNIRNAMTPMINGLDRLAKAFRISSSLRVTEATSQLAGKECPAERRDKLLQYIDASFRHIEQMGADAIEDLDVVTLQARQIEDILADQERFSNVAPVIENVQLDEIVGEATHVIPKTSQSQVSVSKDPGLKTLKVQAHRVGLLQVLGNLILNAFEAIQRHRSGDGRIMLTAQEEIIDDQPVVRLIIHDNGCGFDEATAKRIFQRGFSSKNRGDTTGLGLHWCANAIAGMNGRIVAESEGLGHGAEFHVLLPTAQGAMT